MIRGVLAWVGLTATLGGCFSPDASSDDETSTAADSVDTEPEPTTSETTASEDSGSPTAGSDDPENPMSDSTTSTDEPSVCGDGIVEAEEICDDGINDGTYDGCLPDCSGLGPYCGDGETDEEEDCDDGDDIDGNGCNTDCIASGSTVWDTQGNGNGSDLGIANTGQLIAVGAVEERGWIAGVNPNGRFTWSRAIGASNSSDHQVLSVVVDGDRFFASGSTTDPMGSARHGLLLAMGLDGTELWQDIDGGVSDEGYYPSLTKVGDRLAVINLVGQSGEVRQYGLDGTFISADSIPDLAANNEIGGGRIGAINGGFVLAGHLFCSGSWLGGFDGAAEPVWAEVYGSQCQFPISIVGDEVGSRIIIVGEAYVETNYRGFRAIRTPQGGMLDTQERIIPGVDTGELDAAVDSLGNLVIVGYQDAQPVREAVVHKYDPQGGLLWSRNLGPHGNAVAVVVDEDNFIYVMTRLLWLAKLTP